MCPSLGQNYSLKEARRADLVNCNSLAKCCWISKESKHWVWKRGIKIAPVESFWLGVLITNPEIAWA